MAVAAAEHKAGSAGCRSSDTAENGTTLAACSCLDSCWQGLLLTAACGADEVQYPSRWQRDNDGQRSYVFLFPLMPGSYGLAYDEDGDSLNER